MQSDYGISAQPKWKVSIDKKINQSRNKGTKHAASHISIIEIEVSR